MDYFLTVYALVLIGATGVWAEWKISKLDRRVRRLEDKTGGS